jgi:charged multivesicular body protein 7
VFTKLEKAADQVEIVRVMQASTLALRTLHAQTGGVEKVEDVVEELRQEMANVEEVTNVISDTGQVVDEGELDEELQAMEAAEREAAEKRGAEKREAEKREAEKREAEKREAEITRQRLAELDRIAKGRAEKEADLEESIGRLSNMSLEDGSRTRHAEQEKV